MIKRQFLGFVAHWIFSSLGMWLCFLVFFHDADNDVSFYAIAGLVFSLVNSILRPIGTMMTLPLSLITLGLSTILVNTLMVALTLWIIHVPRPDFIYLVLTSLVMSLINGLVNFLLLPYTKK